ncbi:hypothetical protein MPSEU_000459100 [Mayamaea pseudoterrestris]|nr:hypothetical protein MPSEU_000459100 [Mayamaea pseudoterrestris]
MTDELAFEISQDDLEAPLLSAIDEDQQRAASDADDAAVTIIASSSSSNQNDDEDSDDNNTSHYSRCCCSSHVESFDCPLLQLTSMISNLSTSYNVVNVSMVLPILQQLHHSRDTHNTSFVATSLLAGMMLGQVLGGALGDVLGKLRALHCVMLLQVFASLASSSVSHSSSLYLHLGCWRFLLGIGAGAVYPLAAVISAEQAGGNNARRTSSAARDDEPLHAATSTDASQQQALSRVVLTFSMQGIGFLLVPLAAVILLQVFPTNLDLVWRLLLALGSLPGIFLLALHCATTCRQGRPEMVSGTPDMQTINDGSDLSVPHESSDDNLALTQPLLPDETPPRHLGLLEAIQSEEDLVFKLMGTALPWFLFDVLFYGNTLFQPIVMSAAFGSQNENNSLLRLQRIARDSLLLSMIALPGYFVAAWALGTKSRFHQTPRFVMLQGFACMFILYLVIGTLWSKLQQSPALLILLYGLTFFFANYGPNTTTFVLPALVYAAPCRATLNGASAAAGKLGALVGAALFAPMAHTFGNEAVMLVCSVVALVSFAVTYKFVKI